MRIANIMTRDPVSIGSDETLGAARVLMDEENIRHLPVVEDGCVIGVLSDRDLLDAVGWFAGEDGTLETFAEIDQESQRVSDAMHAQPVTVHPDDELVSVSLDLMLRGIGSVPVIGERRELLGIVTDTDLLNAFLRASWEGLLGPESDPPVSNYMAEKVVSLSPDTPFGKTVALCRTNRIHHLPVVEGGNLVGVVSDRDLRWATGRGMPADAPVSSLMATVLRTVQKDALCSHAARMMTEFKVSCLPVVDGKKLESIITTTDLLEHCGYTLWELESFQPTRLPSPSRRR